MNEWMNEEWIFAWGRVAGKKMQNIIQQSVIEYGENKE